MELSALLRSIESFSSLDDEQIRLLEKICTSKKIVKKEILFYEGDEPESLYYLLEGELQMLKNQPDLKQLHVHNIQAPSFVAEITIFQNITYPATAEATKDSLLLCFDKHEFEENFLKDPSLLEGLNLSLSKKIRYLMHSIDAKTMLNAEAKIAKYILNYEEQIQDKKHKDIAFELNTTPETVSRVLKKFVTQGILFKSTPITIKDKKSLQNLAT